MKTILLNFLICCAILGNGVSTAPTDPVTDLGSTPKLICTKEHVSPTECSQALMHFHTDPEIGDFHLGPPSNIYSLPFPGIEGGCKITIDLIPGVRTYPMPGSWPQIWAMTNTLIAACTVSRYGNQVTGGTIEAGFGRRLKISLTRYKPKVGNASEVATA